MVAGVGVCGVGVCGVFVVVRVVGIGGVVVDVVVVVDIGNHVGRGISSGISVTIECRIRIKKHAGGSEGVILVGIIVVEIVVGNINWQGIGGVHRSVRRELIVIVMWDISINIERKGVGIAAMEFVGGGGGSVLGVISIRRVWRIPFTNNIGSANGVYHGRMFVKLLSTVVA